MVTARLPAGRPVDAAELLAKEVQFAQRAVNGQALIGRQFQPRQPCATLTAQHVGHRRVAGEVVQPHRGDLVLTCVRRLTSPVASLSAPDGRQLGVIQIFDKRDAEFTHLDEECSWS